MATPRLSTRYAGQISFRFLFWMIAVALLVSAGGITYASLKSLQVVERTAINNLQREIAECNMNINQYKAKTNEMASRWAIRDRLNQTHSRLEEISHNQIEIAQRMSDGSRVTFAATASGN